MSKGREFFIYLSLISLIMAMLLFFSFAGAGPASGGSELKKAREALEEKLGGMPGFAGIAHSEEKGVIIVFLENEEAMGKVPDRFQGFAVRKQVTGRFKALSIY